MTLRHRRAPCLPDRGTSGVCTSRRWVNKDDQPAVRRSVLGRRSVEPRSRQRRQTAGRPALGCGEPIRLGRRSRNSGGCRWPVPISRSTASCNITLRSRMRVPGEGTGLWLQRPVVPSSCSRRMSACPACRAVSLVMWAMTQRSVYRVPSIGIAKRASGSPTVRIARSLSSIAAW